VSGGSRRRIQRASRRQQHGPGGLVQLKRVGQQPHGFEPRRVALPTLQVTDAAQAQPGEVSQRLLTQAGRQPVPPEREAESGDGRLIHDVPFRVAMAGQSTACSG
jgi:hypothetical protein